ncbi:NAD(P)-dependent oxidoreductase [Pedobacter arcticus]|uniref:NAD(P)-dependent oxidoreductase n=1 Tax=Pedobacter arcticus TaxID=752140 RepID=UPI000306439B|nr:NAD(P)H-binding protein [Pedobacter arcticus]
MKSIAIIGATGSTGKELVRLAIESNFKVTAVVRNPTKIELQKKLTILKGDVTDLDSLILALKDVDYVISCFGPTNHRKVGNLMSLGTLNIVKACEENGVARLIFLSGFVQSNGNEFSFLNRLAVKILQRYFYQSYNDKVIAESTIKNSSLNWVIVRAVALNYNVPTGKYMAGIKSKVYPFKALHYSDCAKCLLDAIAENSWNKQIINVGKLTD